MYKIIMFILISAALILLSGFLFLMADTAVSAYERGRKSHYILTIHSILRRVTTGLIVIGVVLTLVGCGLVIMTLQGGV